MPIGKPNPNLREQVIALRKSGLYPTEIAKQLGVTRNQVIGICYRAGLSDPNVDRAAITKRFGNPPRGEAHWKAKLTAADVAAIRREYVPQSREFGGTALARRYDVHPFTVYSILSGRGWKVAA